MAPVSGPVVTLPEELGYLADGDIVRVVPNVGEVTTLYRKSSPSNGIFLTEQCNCRCLFCPQPPREVADAHWVQTWQEAIALMDPRTEGLGITGGEPTMLPEGLLEIIRTCRNHLPHTALHLLSNGRMFNYASYCERMAALNHPDLVVGVPLYSDIPHEHDFLVQCPGAFDQTLRGVMNLARFGLRLEIRVVLCRQTVPRLASLATFISRNLPFVGHVAVMGLELMGYAKANADDLWLDPPAYQGVLAEAVGRLVTHRIGVSIYNHPLCVLRKELRPFARKSISDWKVEYFPTCPSCSQRERCGGAFFSTRERLSPFVANC
ncbi:MAG: His-Xaa-Ser system radical SAM maturase HxsC [Planctomycetota bacterium]|nr:His-Xaa-Ser system radical SAM maturase HxsC [Planctomycetota bacterium]